MKLHDINIDEIRLAEFCRRSMIRELLLFGSLTRDDFGPESDVDVAVEYDPQAGTTLFDFAGHELALSEIIGRRVHLIERSTIPTKVAAAVLRSAVRAYAA